jgi:hypothetical protein
MSQTRYKQEKDRTKREQIQFEMHIAQNAVAQVKLKASELLEKATKKIKSLKTIIAVEAAVIAGMIAWAVLR